MAIQLTMLESEKYRDITPKECIGWNKGLFSCLLCWVLSIMLIVLGVMLSVLSIMLIVLSVLSIMLIVLSVLSIMLSGEYHVECGA
jgi:ABC-type multidrug transport system permease subunit